MCVKPSFLSLFLSKISQTGDSIDFVSRSTVEFENLKGIEDHEDRRKESRSIACQREKRWSVKRASNNFLLGKPPPTRPYRVSICRINEKVANGVRGDRLGKVRPDRFASRREHIVVEASFFFFFESCSKIRRSEEGLRCFWGRSRDSISFDALLFRFVTKGWWWIREDGVEKLKVDRWYLDFWSFTSYY